MDLGPFAGTDGWWSWRGWYDSAEEHAAGEEARDSVPGNTGAGQAAQEAGTKQVERPEVHFLLRLMEYGGDDGFRSHSPQRKLRFPGNRREGPGTGKVLVALCEEGIRIVVDLLT